MITIVFAHPWHGSFNKAILDAVTQKLDAEKKAYQVIDLYKDKFTPFFTEAELAVYSKGEALDPLVKKYQEMISKSDELYFVFPIWWGTFPGILKGFLDKLLLVNFSHNYNNGWTPLLKIQKCLVMTTSQSPTANYVNSIQHNFIEQILTAVGVRNITWLNNAETTSGTREQHTAFLKKIADAV